MSVSHRGLSPRRSGAIGCADGSILWRVWAPYAGTVTLVLLDGQERREVAMTSELRGYHRAAVGAVEEGQRYAFRLDGGPERADPCSLWQPDGVDGPSALVFPDRFSWTDHAWQGVQTKDLIFYEIHVGTFTPEGTFEAVISRLDDLRELGITAIEIMPIGQFPGARNWGYDGVFPYAAQNTYGGPRGLQRLIDACHRAGLAVYLDVVYNHFGPEANYLGEFGPFFTDRHKTPWGDAVNYDRAGCDAVRDFVLDNVRMWLEEFHLDGLRLDAADTIVDLGPHHILRAIKETALAAGESRGWPAVITAESDLNDPRLLYPASRGGYGLDAQWMDDFHHAFHAFFTGERQWYYCDFGQPEQLAEVLSHPYVYNGVYSAYRDRKHGARADDLGDERFVVCLQNHDQVGNRAVGDRLGVLLKSWARQRLAASYLLLSPYLPLLFMGEEYGEENPFPFFCSYRSEELARAVREGRRREYGASATDSIVPDPGAVTTFASARLSWSWPEGTARAALRRLYRDLLTARREWPALRDQTMHSAHLITVPDGNWLLLLRRGLFADDPAPASSSAKGTDPFVARPANEKGTDRFIADRIERPTISGSDASRPRSLEVYFNLGGQPQVVPVDGSEELILSFSSEAAAYGGCRDPSGPICEIFAFECLAYERTAKPHGP